MGRKHKKRLSEHEVALIAEKEKEKIRKRVLQAFCKRTKSPNGSSGIIAREDSRLLHKSLPDVCSKEASSSSSSMSDNTGRHCSRRHRKTSSKHGSKIANDRGKKDVSRHMKMASDCRYQGLHPTHSRGNGRITNKDICRITSTRLTRRIGLFNQGKKSSTVARAEIAVPDNVRKKTEEDLKKIIEHSDDENKPPCLSFHYSPDPKHWVDSKMRDKAAETSELNHQDVGYKSGGSVFSVTPATPKRRLIPPSTSSSSCRSYGSEDSTGFLQEPPYLELAEKFAHELKPREFFPRRNLLEETLDHLKKLMRQNAPRSATPTPKLLGSAKRSLQLDKVHPHDSNKQRETCKENVVQSRCDTMAQGSISKPSQENTKCLQGNIALVKNTGTSIHQCNSSKTLGMEDRLKQHQNALALENRPNQCNNSYDYIATTDFKSRAISEAREYFHSSLSHSANDVREITHSISESSTVKDGTLLLQFNDEVAQKAKVTEELSSLLKHTSWKDEGRSSVGSAMLIDSQKSINSSQSSGYHGSQIISMLQNNMLVPNNQKTVTGIHQYPNFLSNQQKEERLSSVLSADVLDQAESMDILDYLDTGTKDLQSKRRASSLDLSEDKLNPWNVADLPPLQKPSLDTPSPPDDLFRKFYR